MAEPTSATENPSEPQARESEFKIWGIGHVAANKPLNSWVIEVTDSERSLLLDKEVTDNVTELEVKGQRADGTEYASKATVGSSMQATWLPFADPNRFTAPDVRRGMQVMLYKFGTGDQLFWATTKPISKLMRLETVTHAYSASPTDEPDLAKDNVYVQQFSSHLKHYYIRTSVANEEKTGWTFKLDGGNGQAFLSDDDDNQVLIDNEQRIVELRNSDGTVLRLQGKDIYIKCDGDLIEEIGGNRRRKVAGEDQVEAGNIEEKSGSTINTVAGGARSVSANGINHNSSGNSTSRSSGTTSIDGSRIDIGLG